MKTHERNARGFSLIETLVAMLMATIVLSAVAVTYSSSVRGYTRNREMAQTQMRARLSLDYVAQEFRNAGLIVNWDQTAPAGVGALDGVTAIGGGAAPAAGTDFITLRYAVGPFVASVDPNTGAPVPARAATLTLAAAQNATTLTVDTLNLDGDATNGNEIAAGSLIVVYVPPTQVNVRRVQATVGATTITLDPLGPALSTTFAIGSVVAVVQETSLWVQQAGARFDLMMRSTGDATNRQLATNVEDLQLVFLDADGNQTIATDPNVRAVRLGLTSRSARTVQNRTATVPPSLEDNNRAGEAADQFLRQVEQTTVYLRNYGVLS